VPTEVDRAQVEQWLAALTLEEKCRLLGGASSWRTHAIDRVGIPALKMSDGPNGVRGESPGSRRTPGVAVPVAIALGATWDPALVGRIGDLLGREAVRKGAHVLLAPTVNLHRTPIGGRTFECFSEDPELTAVLATELIRGVQAHDVAVTVKHFVANDTERERMTVDVRVDEVTLRELYLRPFEAAVVEGGAWGVMSAYNRLAGEHCAQHRGLLTDLLRREWGFDGFVVSDWHGSHDTVGSARAGLDVAMPGPRTIYGAALQAAVERGDLEESTVDDLVRDVLVLVERTRARERSADRPEESVDDPAERALCREAAAAGTVLVRNEGDVLPLGVTAGMTFAVLGPNAADTRTMGGGSSSLEPLSRRSLLEALTERLAEHGARVVHAPGVRIDKLAPVVRRAQLRDPDGQPGLRLEFTNGGLAEREGAPVVATAPLGASLAVMFGSVPDGVDPEQFTVRLSGAFVPEVSGVHRLGVVLTGPGRVRVGSEVAVDDPRMELPRGDAYFGWGCEEQLVALDLVAGEPVALDAVMTGFAGFSALRLGVRAPEAPDLLERAVGAAAAADVAVVVVGTTDEWETEGEDRTTIALPGRQDELVHRVAAVNPRTVVVVNAGAPVAMPWLSEVAAVVVPFFGGMEMAEAVTDVLLGVVDPGGRLPVTHPVALDDAPAWPHYRPVDGVQTYGEGLLIGYRGHERAGVAPLVPFGHGLSYGRFEWGPARTSAETLPVGSGVVVEVALRNTGDRPGTEVVQVYLAPHDVADHRPLRTLAGWTKVRLDPGESTTARVVIGPRAFRQWDPAAGGWVIPTGQYDLVLATSATDERQRLRLHLT
jgi:beta-glucosidase